MISPVFSEMGHILLAVSFFASLGRFISKSHRGAVVGFAIGAVLTILPLEYSPQFYTRSGLGDLSVLSWFFLVHLLCWSVYGVTLISVKGARSIALVTVVCGLLIYPASLGAGLPDIYRLGFGSFTLILGVSTGALAHLIWGRYLIAFWAIFTMFAYGCRLHESLNFWDCLFDYPSFVISFFILLRWCFKRGPAKPDLAEG